MASTVSYREEGIPVRGNSVSNGEEVGKLRSVLRAQNSPVWLKHQHSGLRWWAEAEMHRALGQEGDLPWEALPWAGPERASARGTGRRKHASPARGIREKETVGGLEGRSGERRGRNQKLLGF